MTDPRPLPGDDAPPVPGDPGTAVPDDAPPLLPGDGPGPPVDQNLLRAALAELVVRVEAARRLSPPAGLAVLRSIVDATVVLFGAEAASIALHDATADRLVFEVAAGSRGEGVVGLSIGPGEGVAGYVFSTGQPIALSDVATDARFGRSTAEQTGYVPRSLVAVPLVDDDGVIGVLEVLDKRGDRGFDLRDIELAGVFARQATVAIRSSRIERDAAALLRSVVRGVVERDGSADEMDANGDADADARAAGAESEARTAQTVEAITTDAIRGLNDLAGDDRGDRLWALADQIARLRTADPGEVDLVTDLLDVLVRRAERARSSANRRPAFGSRAAMSDRPA